MHKANAASGRLSTSPSNECEVLGPVDDWEVVQSRLGQEDWIAGQVGSLPRREHNSVQTQVESPVASPETPHTPPNTMLPPQTASQLPPTASPHKSPRHKEIILIQPELPSSHLRRLIQPLTVPKHIKVSPAWIAVCGYAVLLSPSVELVVVVDSPTLVGIGLQGGETAVYHFSELESYLKNLIAINQEQDLSFVFRLRERIRAQKKVVYWKLVNLANELDDFSAPE
jgi:hypothetical protein